MHADMLLLTPSPTAQAWLTHNTYRHISISSVLPMEGFNLFQPFDLLIQTLYLLHQLNLIGSTVDIDPFQMFWKLDALVKWHIYWLLQKVFRASVALV